MAYQFNGFKATKPVVRFKDSSKKIFEAFFIVYSGSKKLFFRYSDGVNSLPEKERERAAKIQADLLWERLQNSWDPRQQQVPFFDEKKADTVIGFSDALQLALDIKTPNLSKFSAPDYKGAVRFIKKAAKETGILHADVRKLERKDMRLLIATAKEQNEWSNKARNKYLTILKSLLSVLEDEDMIAYNPAHRIKNEPEEETLGYRVPEDDELGKIILELAEKAPAFLEYVTFIYMDGVRRKELLGIEIGDININRREITIRAEVAKTNRERKVPIPDELMEILLQREVYSLPKNWYLFSSDDFRSGPEPYHPNTPTRWWKMYIIDGLGIDCKMYSMKHRGGDDKIRAGIELDVLKTLYGHKSKRMTEGYAKAVRDHYKENLIEKSPSLAQVINIKKKTG